MPANMTGGLRLREAAVCVTWLVVTDIKSLPRAWRISTRRQFQAASLRLQYRAIASNLLLSCEAGGAGVCARIGRTRSCPFREQRRSAQRSLAMMSQCFCTLRSHLPKPCHGPSEKYIAFLVITCAFLDKHNVSYALVRYEYI